PSDVSGGGSPNNTEGVDKKISFLASPHPPSPFPPANELCGYLLLELNRPAEASTYFQNALKRTPNRPKVIFGLARAAQDLGDNETARKRYEEFLTIWRAADLDRPELVTARKFLHIVK